MKRILLITIFIFSFCESVLAQNDLAMPVLIDYTSTRTTVFNQVCYQPDGIQFYINNQKLIKDVDYQEVFCAFGICIISYPFGTLKPGDKFEVRDACGSTPASTIIQDSFVYLEVPNGASFTGNGINSTDVSPPYSKLSNRISLGKCEPVAINSHVLHNFYFFLSNGTAAGTFTSGEWLYNNTPISSADVIFDKFGSDITHTINPDGSVSYSDGSVGFTSKKNFTGEVPTTFEYRHNGVLPFDVQELTFGPLGVRLWNNGRVSTKEYRYDGSVIENDINSDFTNSVFKLSFANGFFKLFIDDVEVKSIARSVIYSASNGSISNTSLLPYATGVNWTPSASGEQYVSAIIDGVRTVRQYFQVAEDMVINESITNVACNGESNGSITVNTTGGHGTKAFSRDGTTYQSSNVFGGLAAGNYTIYVRDASGCTAQKTVSVSQNSELTISANATNANCTGESNGSINISAGGGAGFYQYKVDGNSYSNNANITGLAAGNYTAWVKDAVGCEKSIPVTVGINSTLNASTTITNIDCFAASTGQILINTTGTTNGTVRYSLNDIDYQTGNTFASLAANNYTVYVKDNLCKVVLTNQNVSQNSEINIGTSKTDVSCFGLSDGAFTINPSGGSPAYLFSLNGSDYSTTPENSTTFENKIAGNYKVWVQDTKGCIKESGIIIITQPNALTANVSSKTDVLCFGLATGSASIAASEGTAPYTYGITGGILGTSNTISSLSAGNYSFSVKDAKGCTTGTSIEILQGAEIIATSTQTTTVSCFGGGDGVVSITASGGTGTLQYAKNSDGNFGNSPVFSGLSAGNTTFQIKDANNCMVAAPSVNVSQEADIVFSVSQQKNVLCFGGNTGEVSLVATGGVGNFSYSSDGTNFGTSPNFAGLVKNPYTFTVKDGNSCTKTLNTNITEPSLLTANLTKTRDVLCFGGNTGIIQTTTGGGTTPYQYALDGLNFVNGNTANSHTIDTLKIGTYQVTVKDANGCLLTTNQISLSQPTEMVIGIGSQTNVNCFGDATGIITLSATNGTPGYTYQKESSGFQASPTFSSLSSGTVNFRVKDANGCEKPVTSTITQPTAPYQISLVYTTNLSCYENRTGEIVVANSGGTGPYQVSLDNATFQTSPSFGGLSAQAYTIHGKDALDCPFSLPVDELTQPTDIVVQLLQKTDVDCDYYSRGEALVTATGSNGGFNYTLNGSDFNFNTVSSVNNTSGLFQNLKAGDYTITARDVRSCPKDFTVTIVSKNAAIDFDIDKALPSSCLAADGSISILNARGGRQPFKYGISTQASFSDSPSFSNLLNGNYIVTVSDSLCYRRKEVDLKLPNSINAGYTISPISCTTPEANLSVSPISGANGNYELSFNGGAFSSNTNFTNLHPNVYAITVRDNPLSCQTILSVEIKEQNRADLQFTNRTNILCFGNNTGQIAVQGNNNMNPFTYALNGGGYSSNGTFTNLTAGTYKVYARNRIGCIDSLQAILTQPTLLVNTSTKTDNLCFGDNSGELVITGTGGVSPYEYSIDNSTYVPSTTFQNLTVGNYTTYLRDAHGCVSPQGISLIQPSDLIVSPQYIDTVRCFGESNGKVQVLASGGTPSYQFSRDNASYLSSDIFEGLPIGTYTFYVKDANQCVRQQELTTTQPDLLELALVSQSNPLCFGGFDGTVKVNASGGNGGNGFTLTNIPSQPTGNFTDLGQNNYVATVTDRRGCLASVSNIQLRYPSALNHSISSVMPLCFGDNNGKVTINISGGTPGYGIQLDGSIKSPEVNGSTFVFDNYPARKFSFTTIDQNNCTQKYDFELLQPTALKSVVNMTPNKCFADSTGVLQLQGIGATAPYTYAIQNGYRAGDDNFSNKTFYDQLLANTYNVNVNDFNGCRYDTLVTVSQPSKVVFQPAYIDTVRCFGENNGKVQLLASGGTPSYQYSLDNVNFQSSDTLKGLKAGKYSFYVRDQNACKADAFMDFEVTEPDELLLSLAKAENPLCIGEKNGIITLSTSGGNGSNVYYRDNVFKQDSLRFVNLSEGEFTFKVLDRRSCEASVSSVSLEWPAGLSATAITYSPVCYGEANGKIEIIANGGVGGYSALINGQLNAPSSLETSKLLFEKLTAGIYTLQVADANGCMVNLPTTVEEAEPLEPIKFGDSSPVCIGQEVILNAGNKNNLLAWFLDDAPLNDLSGNQLSSSSITVKEPGTYLVKVKNETGCELSESFILTNNANALDADFLMTVQAFVADTVFALDISNPTPSEIVWTLPPEAQNLDENVNGLTYRIDIPGEYEIKMLARTDNCENIKIRTIKIFEKDDIESTDDDLFYNSFNIISSLSVFPNPNFGKFEVDIGLTKTADIKLRITRASTGVLLYEEERSGADNYSLNIDVDRFIQDTYILTVTAGNSTLVKRILLMN